jgi:hypothetical protein
MDDASARDEFLAGSRPDEVALFVAEADASPTLAERGVETERGVLLVLPGERGRAAFSAGTGTDAMAFAGQAMSRDGRVALTLDSGECPEDNGEERHAVRFLLAFAEAENPEVGGQYAEGDVIHAYAKCDCGVAYADRWVVGERG